MLADIFAFWFAEEAAELGIPASFIWGPPLNSIMVPPPFPWLPLLPEFTVPPAPEKTLARQIAVKVADAIAPVLCTTSSIIHGWRMYGFPRLLFTTIYSRPLLSLVGQSFVINPVPRSVLVLGPPQAKAGGEKAEEAGDARVITIPLPCSEKRPLSIRPARALYVAFGSIVTTPVANAETLCEAFTILLDAGEFEAVLYVR